MSRSIDDLLYWFQPKVASFQSRCLVAGYPIKILRTLTDEPTQNAIWTIGRGVLTLEQELLLKNQGLFPSSQDKPRTNAEHANQTPHGLGLAFDCIPLKAGQPWWDFDQWIILYKIAEKCGLDALGDSWGEFMSSDKGHFQEPGWRVYK